MNPTFQHHIMHWFMDYSGHTGKSFMAYLLASYIHARMPDTDLRILDMDYVARPFGRFRFLAPYTSFAESVEHAEELYLKTTESLTGDSDTALIIDLPTNPYYSWYMEFFECFFGFSGVPACIHVPLCGGSSYAVSAADIRTLYATLSILKQEFPEAQNRLVIWLNTYFGRLELTDMLEWSEGCSDVYFMTLPVYTNYFMNFRLTLNKCLQNGLDLAELTSGSFPHLENTLFTMKEKQQVRAFWQECEASLDRLHVEEKVF